MPARTDHRRDRKATRRARKQARRPLGFVGGGNMAGALVKGLLASRTYGPDDIWVAEPLAPQRRALSRAFRVTTTADNCAVVGGSSIVVLAVKPQVMDSVVGEIRQAVRPSTLFVSIAAGVRLDRLERALGAKARVVRVMPNTPALVGRGMSVAVGGRNASRRDVSRALAIFRAVGDAVAVEDEEILDAVTGLSGSGPAFVYAFAEALIDGGRRVGIEDELATRLALRTVAGAAAMLTETGLSPAELRTMVTSPGGTTIAGLSHLDAQGFARAVQGAVAAATSRARELAGG